MRAPSTDSNPGPDTTDVDHLQGLERRLNDLDRIITKHYKKTLDKTNRLEATSNHICDALRMHSQALINEQSSINHTKHVVTAQARTIAAQAKKIASQQEMMEVMQHGISSLSGWNIELQNRINEHDEELSRRNDNEEAIRKLWKALKDQIKLFEYIETQTYWMNMYSKQTMLLRAMELEEVATLNEDASVATAARSAYSGTTLVGNQSQQDILLDRIVVKMIKDHAPDRSQGVYDGFEIVHGISPMAFEEDLKSRAVTHVE